jgi:hypothetical protein
MSINHLLFGLVIFLTTGCNQQSGDNKSHEHETGTPNAIKETGTTTLTLNAGRKWKLDSPTRENMKVIRLSFEQAAKQARPDYTALVADLQAKSNKLVSECRMSGKDHDMLHLWLADYLSSLKEMNSEDVEAQEAGFHKVEKQLGIFNQYFE